MIEEQYEYETKVMEDYGYKPKTGTIEGTKLRTDATFIEGSREQVNVTMPDKNILDPDWVEMRKVPKFILTGETARYFKTMLTYIESFGDENRDSFGRVMLPFVESIDQNELARIALIIGQPIKE